MQQHLAHPQQYLTNRSLGKFSNPRTEEIPISDGVENARRRVSITSLAQHVVAPPVDLNIPHLYGEEYDDTRDGNGAREGSGGDEVVLKQMVSFGGQGIRRNGTKLTLDQKARYLFLRYSHEKTATSLMSITA